MIKVLLLDVGDTLVKTSASAVFPHVREALGTLSSFETAAGDPLVLCVVSDFEMPVLRTAAKIKATFQKFTTLLDSFGLKQFFEPVNQHITLSTHAGVTKPDPKIFKLALQRLGLPATGFDSCLFITENKTHLEACQALGMKTLRFGETTAPGVDFTNWSKAPLLVSHIVHATHQANLESALGLMLATEHDLEITAVQERTADNRIRLQAQCWHPVPLRKASGAEEIQVQLPTEVEVRLDEHGNVLAVNHRQPDPEQVAEAAHSVATLEANHQLAHQSMPATGEATHLVEKDEKGRNRLVRKRFSAI